MKHSAAMLCVFVATVAGPACAQRAPAPRTATVHRSIPYVPGGHARQMLDLYLPTGARAPMPVVLVIHGGAWRGGDKADNPQVSWGVPILLRAGFAVASMNHRYSEQAVFPAQIHDAKAAVRWLRANRAKYGLDSAHIGVWGMSSGAHLAAILGTSANIVAMDGTLGATNESTRVHAVVTWYAPTDFLQMDAQRLPEGMRHDGPGSPESRLIGGALQQNKELARAASPITYITSDDPPFLLFHGDQDQLVPYQQSELLVAALRAAKVDAELRILRGAGHGARAFRADAVSKQMVEFFDRHLRSR